MSDDAIANKSPQEIAKRKTEQITLLMRNLYIDTTGFNAIKHLITMD